MLNPAKVTEEMERRGVFSTPSDSWQASLNDASHAVQQAEAKACIPNSAIPRVSTIPIDSRRKSLEPPTHRPAVSDAKPMEAELSMVLSSKSFAKSTRLKRVLEYIVNRSLTGDVGALKEYTLGLEVFDRGASFDPSSDPIVRVEASRLRRRLYAYYATEGAANAFQIHIPRGAYVAAVRARQAELSANTLTAKSEVNAIMVLPFSTYEHYPDRPDAHARILSDHLIHLLTQSSQVRVVSRFSSTQIDPNMDVRALGDCFGAQLVVEGSILDAEDQYQILTYLVEVTQGYNLWSGHYQAGHDVLFTVAHEIAADLISGIQGLRGELNE